MVRYFGVGLCKCFVPWIILSGSLRVTGEVFLEQPLGVRPDGDLVVDSGSDFTLTCRGDTPLHWTNNDYDPDSGEERSEVVIESREEHGQQVSTLTVRDAYYMDTGFYVCYPRNEGAHSPQAQRIYVFVKDPYKLLAVNDTLMIQTRHQFGMAEIPCRPTDPDVEVKLMKDGETEMKPGTYHGMLVKYNKHSGFTFINLHEMYSGQYTCHITRNGSELATSELHILHILPNTTSVDRPHVAVSPLPVVAGTNITFDCSVHYDLGVKIYLNWSVPHAHLKQSEKLVEHQAVSEEEKQGGITKGYIGRRKMTLYDVSKHDEGEYICHVIDSSNNKNQDSVMLTVLKTPILELNLRGQKNATEIHVNPGQMNVQLLVDINAHPPPKSVQWFDNEMKPIIGEQTPFSMYTVKNTATESKLIIRSPDVHSSGTYTLVVNNDAFNKSINVTLQVKGLPDLRVKEGNALGFYLVGSWNNIDCEVFAFPRPNITWYFRPCPGYPACSSQFTMLPLSDYFEHEMATDIHSPLKSSVRIRANVTGEVQCKACNTLGCANETTTMLLTDVEKGFSIDAPKLVVETDNVSLSCGASKYYYTNNLQWLYAKTGNYSPVIGLEMSLEETKYSYFSRLNIPNVTKNHSGSYMCSADFLYRRGKKEQLKYFMQVKNLQKPVIHRKNITTKSSVQTGAKVIWHCKVQHGSPPPIIVWYKDGERLTVDRHSNIELKENNQTLEIRVGLEDEARYECHAINKVGYDMLIYEIQLTDKYMFLYRFIWYIVPLVGLLLVLAVIVYCYYVQKYKKKIKDLKEVGLEYFEKGKVESINPELDIGEQADLLPYDRQKWEFPRDKLKLGKQLGAGAFGMVLKAEAYELMEPGVATVVAVKMVKRNSDVTTIRALASELKIMIHLGKHLNVVNVLGACTGDLNKRELLVLVEYCRYGNLRSYLLQHRGAFLNQVNPRTGQFDPTCIEPTSPSRFSNVFSNGEVYSNGKASMRTSAALSQTTDTTLVMSDMSTDQSTTPVGEDGYLISRDHEWRNQDRGDYKDGLRPVCTQDLICWSFQIARGMEYLASRKVLHGDLAARNVLLAEDNIVKICDFGFSKSVYRDSNYQKKGDGPLPIKWMAVESIRDRVFSTQSDVWSYGVTLWELFSLGCTPYPGMEAVKEVFQKLAQGYRMEQPKYATKQVYQIMIDCWHDNPHSRPSFTELAERMGGMLEDTVRTHYVDLNDPYLQQNTEFLAQQDYLSMVRSPTYMNWSPGYTTMKPASPRTSTGEAMELTPMLSQNAKVGSESLTNSPAAQQNPPAAEEDTPDSPESPPITKPIGNNYVNVTHVLGFSNPSYQNLGRPKKSPYINVP